MSRKALPFCCAPTGFPSKAVPFLMVPQQQVWQERERQWKARLVEQEEKWRQKVAAAMEDIHGSHPLVADLVSSKVLSFCRASTVFLRQCLSVRSCSDSGRRTRRS
eukprot:SAG22_NODE_10214_length_547_cov_1.236607_1_plen_105_part_10